MCHVIRILPALLVLSLAAVQADDAQPVDALTREVRALAADFAKIINKHGGGAVAIGEFSASSDVRGSAGPRVQLVLSQALEQQGIAINAESFRYEIKGDYQPIVDPQSSLLGVKLVGRLIERETGEPLAEKPTGRFVFGSETVPAMLGLNVSGGPPLSSTALSDRFKEARLHPQVQLQGTVIRGATGHYAIEVLVKHGNHYVAQPVQPDSSGRPFVPLQTDDIFGVRLINNSPHEAAVELCVDGLNCFTFSDQPSKYWILAPGKSLDVLGWHRNDTTTTEFKVVADFPHTAAARLNLKPSSSIGLITASFSACWADESQRPADEQRVKGRGAGFGGEIQFRTETVKRTIGVTRDTLSVRYER